MAHNLVEKSYRIAYAVFQYYLESFAEKAQASIQDITHYIPSPFHISSLSPNLIQQAENIVLGKESIEDSSPVLFSLFENIRLENTHQTKQHQFCYAPKALSPNHIFPINHSIEKSDIFTAYSQLWKEFIAALAKIPPSHKTNLALWLDHFETMLQCFLSNVPSKSPEISLYDLAKSVSSLLVAIELAEDKAKPFLLLQGDFFGIQDFIFSGGSDTQKQAAKLLRGRSFQVSLFTELAALKLLQACDLPSTSQIMNAAGKFLIIMPNTQALKKAINETKAELDRWFIKNTYGLIGLGVAINFASEDDLKNHFEALRDELFRSLETVKLQRLNLLNIESVQKVDYSQGVCRLNRYFPADNLEGLSLISKDQVTIGESLVKKDRLIICDKHSLIYENYRNQFLALDIFGYKVVFTDEREQTGEFGQLAKAEQIYRFWDFSLAENSTKNIWNGYARRYINAYVPIENNSIVPFDEIAEKDQGQVALMTLKGDVDNLGKIFQKGANPANLAKMAALSRQMNQFFSLWLPAFCAENYPNSYTVFAGGDDFFLIGPWKQTQELAFKMQQYFAKYVANNSEIHFSVGMVMTKVGIPVPRLGELAENALEKAKGMDLGKNAVNIFGINIKWADWQKLVDLEQEINRLSEDYKISSAYFYSLIYFAKQATSEKIEDTMWRSRFYYRTASYVLDKLPKEKRDKALAEITLSLGEKGINQLKEQFTIPLFNYFYQNR